MPGVAAVTYVVYIYYIYIYIVFLYNSSIDAKARYIVWLGLFGLNDHFIWRRGYGLAKRQGFIQVGEW